MAKTLRYTEQKKFWNKYTIIRFSICWAILSIGIYLFFGLSMQGTGRPEWYRIVTSYPIQDIPLIISSLLCFRNGLSNRMPSGSKVWLLMGIAILSYMFGNIFFSSWELVWKLNSTGSLGDPFFTLFYVLITTAIIIAITSKRIKLNIFQWLLVGIAGIYASSLAILIMTPAANAVEPTPLVMSVPRDSNLIETAPLLAAANDAEDKAVEKAEPAKEPTVELPDWVAAADKFFKPYGKALNMFYVWCDVVLFCLSIVMILGCWGGKLSTAWRVTAQALGCYYIADMWLAYAANQITDYQSGFALEVFWTLGGLQFGIAAAMEFDAALARQRRTSLRQDAV